MNGPNTEYADMRAAYDALDDKTKAEVAELICEHSLMYSRGQLGFTDFTEEEQKTFAPVRQVFGENSPCDDAQVTLSGIACRNYCRLADG
ncbi:MAG: hypothetical protein CM1200mP18_02720 [Gammaproteobacteria bacterium]|nr:MAG: hypothetical protein CM1200mP18_02720 [Gammaproteobacteria bacterium]